MAAPSVCVCVYTNVKYCCLTVERHGFHPNYVDLLINLSTVFLLRPIAIYTTALNLICLLLLLVRQIVLKEDYFLLLKSILLHTNIWHYISIFALV